MINLTSRLIRFIIRKYNNVDPRKQICDHTQTSITLDQANKQLVFLSKDQCKSCNIHVCNICSESHITQHCYTSLNTNRNLGKGILKDFNYGHLMKLNLTNLKCICGKQLIFHDKDHAMCAACGLLSCSDKCHTEWQKKGNCTYHTNFYEPNPQYNLRSIRLENILNIQKSKIKRWNVAQKTNLSMISCYASTLKDYVYLQRGYRNYGKPQVPYCNNQQDQIIQKLQKAPWGIDFTTHIERLCDCQCQCCISRQIHSVGNCQYQCQKKYTHYIDELSEGPQMHKQCQCTCEFCSSGIVLDTHRKLDCLEHCYKSQYNMSDLL